MIAFLPKATTSTRLLRAFASEANLTRQHSIKQKDAFIPPPQDFVVEDQKDPRITVHFSTKNKPGALEEALRIFWKHDINMTRIVSEPSKLNAQDYDFTIDFEGTAKDEATKVLLDDLQTSCHNVETLEPKVVPWFPTSLQDLDLCVQQTLDAGSDLESDHPGFNDEEYRNRRKEIADWANSFKFGDPIPRINYTDSEVKTWGSVLTKLRGMFNQYACKEYLEIFPLIEKHCGARADNIPQICDISDFLRETTGFQMRPGKLTWWSFVVLCSVHCALNVKTVCLTCCILLYFSLSLSLLPVSLPSMSLPPPCLFVSPLSPLSPPCLPPPPFFTPWVNIKQLLVYCRLEIF